MDTHALQQLVREQYPFPIAHAHKKTLGVLDDNVEKLKCLLETAEVTIQFLALLALAQVRQDLGNQTLPNPGKLSEELNLATPSFGKWNRIAREALKVYWNDRGQLVTPELFEVFWAWDAARGKLCSQPLDNTVIGPLINLRNAFHHGRIQDQQVGEYVTEGLAWLHQLLLAIRFVADYQLSFTQRILLTQDETYLNDLTIFKGCFSPFDQDRWKSAIHLKPGEVIWLQPQNGRHVLLTPFVVFTEHRKGLADLLILNNLAKNKAVYVSSQFGDVLETTSKDWTDGPGHYAVLVDFLEHLRQFARLPDQAEPPSKIEAMPREEESRLSTRDVFQQRYQHPAPTPQHLSPYKFLDYYNPEDHDIFFGREREIRELERKFYNTRLFVLHGESGSGKTSLIRAGLIPRLDPESYIPVYVRMLQEPLQEVKRELLRQLERPDRFSETCQVSLVEHLQHLTETVSKTVIIVLDQFEEFFLRFTEEVRQQFTEEFAACVQASRLDVKFLISLRSDYFASLAGFEEAIPQIFTHQLQLARLTETQALEAVIKPAQRLGIQVDEPMVQIKLLPDLLAEEGGIEPPLLQIVCDALYQNAQSEGRNTIGMADYEAIGDVNGALSKYLDEKLRQFGQCQPQARAVLKALITSAGTKQAVFLPELATRISSAGVTLAEAELQPHYLDKFVNYRLVRVDEVEGRPRYELSHDYLAKHIEAWIAESEREVTKVLELIDRAYETYRATNMLLERSALQMIKPIEEQLVLPTDKQNFVERSKMQVRKQRRGLWLRVAAALMFVALVVGGIFGYQTYRQKEIAIAKQKEAEEQSQRADEQAQIAEEKRKEAERQTRVAQVRRLAAEAQTALAKYPQRSLLLAIESLNVTLQKGEPRVSVAEQALRDALANTGGIGLPGGEVAISPDSHWLAIGGRDGIGRLWDLTEPDPFATPAVLRGHEKEITTVVFSPDSHWLITGSVDATTRLWDLTASDPTAVPIILRGHKNVIVGVVVSPDSHWLITGSIDATARLWDLTASVRGVTSVVLCDPEEWVTTAAFSPDSHWLAIGGMDGITRLWDLTASDPTATPVVLRGHKKRIRTAVFSPNSRWLVTDSEDGTDRLWDLTASDSIPVSVILHGHKEAIWTEFSPDCHWLITSDQDDTARLWDLTASDPAADSIVLRGHDSTIVTVAISPNSRWLVISSADGTVQLWDLTASTLAAASAILRGHEIAFSLDSHWLIIGGLDATARLWDLTASEPAAAPVVLRGFGGWISNVAFSPDSHWLVIGSWDGTVRLWDLTVSDQATASIILHGHEEVSVVVTISPDNHWLVTRSLDDTARLWDLTACEPAAAPVVLRGHEAAITTVVISPDNHWLVTRSQDATIRLWDLTASEPVAGPVRGFEGWIPTVAFSPDSHWLVISSADGTVQLWDLTASDLVAASVISIHYRMMAISPDSRWLVTDGEDDTVRLWDLTASDPAAVSVVLHGHEKEITTAAVSPDSRWLITGSEDTTVRLWDLTTSDLFAASVILRDHEKKITTVAVSPDSRWLITGSQDTTARLWDLSASDPAAAPVVLRDYESWNSTVAFSLDSHWLVIVSEDAIARLWDLTASDPAAKSVVL